MLPLVSLAHAGPAPTARSGVVAIGLNPTAVRRFAIRASRSRSLLSTTSRPDTVPGTTAPVATAPRRVLVAATALGSRKSKTTTLPVTRGAPPTTRRPAPPPPPPPPPTTRPPATVQYGVASWLDTIAPGTCADNVAPMGAILTVTDTATGVSVTCQVVSRGPFVTGRVLDLALESFARLAPPSLGVVNVRVSW